MTKKTYKNTWMQVAELRHNRDIIFTSIGGYGLNYDLQSGEVDEAW